MQRTTKTNEPFRFRALRSFRQIQTSPSCLILFFQSISEALFTLFAYLKTSTCTPANLLETVANTFQFRYSTLARCGISANCVAVDPVNRKQVAVALNNRHIHVYQSGAIRLSIFRVNLQLEHGNLIVNLPSYHETPPHYLSFHPVEQLLLSASATEMILWDSSNWLRKRTLSGSLRIQHVSWECFMPVDLTRIGMLHP